MSVSFVAHESLTIATGTNASPALSAKEKYGDAAVIGIITPSTLDAIDFTIEVSHDGSAFATLTDGSADVKLPGASKAIAIFSLVAFPFFRIKAASNVAANRTFIISKHFTTS